MHSILQCSRQQRLSCAHIGGRMQQIKFQPHLRSRTAKPSPRPYPSAAESNVWHRPTRESACITLSSVKPLLHAVCNTQRAPSTCKRQIRAVVWAASMIFTPAAMAAPVSTPTEPCGGEQAVPRSEQELRFDHTMTNAARCAPVLPGAKRPGMMSRRCLWPRKAPASQM